MLLLVKQNSEFNTQPIAFVQSSKGYSRSEGFPHFLDFCALNEGLIFTSCSLLCLAVCLSKMPVKKGK